MTIEQSENIVIWLGYSAYYIQINGLRFLIDPIFSEYASPFPFMIRAFLGTNIFKSEDFPEINYLIITHDHWEHLDYATIKALKPKIKHVITALGVGSHLRHWGIDNLRITEMDWNDEIFVPSGKIISISARHFSGRCFRHKQTLWSSFLVDIGGCKIYIDGDSGYGEYYKACSDRFGHIELALLEAGQYDEDWKYIHKNP